MSAGLLVAGATTAAALASGLGVDLEARGGVEVDLARARLVARGVVLARDDLRVCCPRAVFRFGADRARQVVCSGGEVSVARGGASLARADRARFLLQKQRLILEGGVVMRLGGGILRGRRVVYDVKKGRLSTRGGPASFVRGDGRDAFSPRPCRAPSDEP